VTATTEASPSEHRDSPWRNREFRLVWGGGLINDVGDWLLMVALPLYVFTETNSGLTTALLFLVELTPAALLGTVAGSLVDRWDLRRTLITTNLLQAVALLPLLAVTPQRIWPAFVVAGVQSVLTRVNNPANTALLPRLVRADQLVAANSAIAIGENLARLIGSPLGGIIVEVSGLRGVVVADGVSFVIVALAVSRVRADAGRAARTTVDVVATVPPPGGVRDGLRVIRRTPPLPTLVATMTLSQFAQGMFLVLFLAFVVRKLGGSGAEVGLLRGVQAVGGVLGGLLVGHLARRARAGRLMGGGFIGMGVISLLMWNAPALTTTIAVYVAFFTLAGLPAVALSVGTLTAAQQSTPTPYLGQLIGTMQAGGAIGSALGTLTAGVLLDRIDVSYLLDGQACIYLVCGAIGLAVVARSDSVLPDSMVAATSGTPGR
jgi:predicted MFS family arabinose efflux permease